jgi:diguanylate cyclase (GGDEF)-like protein/PAS domain S-box-containing protein
VIAAHSVSAERGVAGPHESEDEPAGDTLAALAVRWAALGATSPESLGRVDAPVAARLATLLRRLAAVLAAEPFWPMAARDIGAGVLVSGLCGPDGTIGPYAEEVLPGTLRLLRAEGPAALGARPDRLAAALDELVTGFCAALRDHTEGRQSALLRSSQQAQEGARRALALSESHFRTVYTQGAVGIGVTSLDGMVLDLNPALCRLFGIGAGLDQPRPVTDFVHPDDLADVLDRYRRLVRGEPDVLRTELRFVRPDGLVLFADIVASLVRDESGAPTHLLVVVEDQSERTRLRLRLQRAAYHDQLTQLPNRSLTEQWVQRAFDPGGATRVGVCALDLDGLTRVNDGLGHQVGDQVLLAVAARLQMAAPEHVVTRTGGDEFAVLLSDPEDIDDACRLADRLLDAFATPFLVQGHALTLSASIGVAVAPTAATCPAELMRAADVALSWAKAHGGGRRVVFDPERDAGESARFALLTGLVDGVERGEFRLVHQPLVGLHDGRPHGVEALVRWQHPERGLLGPGQFIELAEHSGAIVPLGEWVLRTACAQAAGWVTALGDDAPFVSVNVSPVQLVEPGFAGLVERVLAEAGLAPDRLQLEITEQAVLADETAALAALGALRSAGVRLALDDFGTGWSSLAWLRRLPVHALKIDGSFIDGLRHEVADPMDSSIVGSLVGMAHALGLEVTAEWVETRAQADRLRALGCDLGQGRWFGDAGPAEWVPELVRRSIDG